MNDMRIYVASLSDYNNGRLEGKWLDLSDYSDASELMEAIQEMLDELTEKYKSVDGEVREEFAVHDYEGIPSTLASEYMGEQDFQQLYDIAEVADDRGVPVEVLIERAGDTGSDDYQALADSLIMSVDGNDESDIVAEYEDQIRELGYDWWSNHVGITKTDQRLLYGEDVDNFKEEILAENPDMDESEAESQAEEMADAEEEARNSDLIGYLQERGYEDEFPNWVYKDYQDAWENDLSYEFDVIHHDGEMYVFTNNYSLGGTILSGVIGAYIGYKIGRAKPQKKGFSTEKKIGRNIKGAFSKKKMAQGGGVGNDEKYYIIFNESGSYNKRDAVLYRDDLSEKDADKIANELNESRPSPTDENLYYVEKASDSRFNYGNINKRFLNSIDIQYKQNILRNIANHYGISIVDAEKEVTDVESELLEEYITDISLRRKVFSDRRNRRYAQGGGVDGKKYFTIYRDEEGSVKTEFDNYSDALADYNEFASDDANIALYEVINGENDLLKENESSAGIEYVELSNGDIVVTLEKIDGKWEEGEVLDGETPYGWGGKRYMGYLKPKDLAQWLSKDYGGNFEIVNQYAKGGGISYNKVWEVIGINLYGKMFKEKITLGRMSDKEDVKNALRRRTDLNIREITSIKEVFADGGSVDEDIQFAVVIKKDDKNYNKIGYSKLTEFITDKQGNEFDKLYFEGKKLPTKYNAEDLNYSVRELDTFTSSTGDRKFILLKELTDDNRIYYYILHYDDKKVYAESYDMNFIKSELKRLTNGKNFYSKAGVNFGEGGGIGFKGLSSKVAKRYEGKSVAPKYQSQYGTTYSKSEAKEVGDKVAGKVYWNQQGRKMAKGGGVDLFSMSKTINDEGQISEMVIAENVSVDEFNNLFSDKGYRKVYDKSLVGFYFAKANGDTIQLIPSFHKKGEILKYAKGGGVDYYRYDVLVHFLTNNGENMEKEYMIPMALSEEDAENRAIEKFHREDFDRYDAEQIQYISVHKREKSFAKGGGVGKKPRDIVEAMEEMNFEIVVMVNSNSYPRTIPYRLLVNADSIEEAKKLAREQTLNQIDNDEYIVEVLTNDEWRNKTFNNKMANGGGVSEFWTEINESTLYERLPYDLDVVNEDEDLISGNIWIKFRKSPMEMPSYELKRAISEDFEYFGYGNQEPPKRVSLMDGSWGSFYIQVENLTLNEIMTLLLELPEQVQERLEERKIKGYKDLGLDTYGQSLDLTISQSSDEDDFEYAKGGGIDSERTYSLYELYYGQPYNFYNEEQDKFIWDEPTKATLFTKAEAENKRKELRKPRSDYYQRTGNISNEIHIGDLYEKGILKYAQGGGISGLDDLLRG